MQIGAEITSATQLQDRALASIRDFIDGGEPPRSIEQVTAAWIQERLNAAGYSVSLTGFDHATLGAGLMGNTYRLTLHHDGDGAGQPQSVVFKCTGDSPISRQLGKRGFGIEGRPGFYGAEVRFYAQFSADLPIRTPRAYATWLSEEEDEFSLLLEDFPQSRAGDEFTGCSAELVLSSMRGLAGLHAPMWNSPVFQGNSWLSPISPALKPVLKSNMDRAIVRVKERHLHHFSAEDMALVEGFAPHYADWVCAQGRPIGLTHGDFRLDNMLFDQGESITLDWQTFTSAHPGRDTGLFLGCSVGTEMRREVQAAALSAYHERLCKLGVENYSLEQCTDDFLFGVFIGLQAVVIGMNAVRSTERGTQMFMKKFARCRATIEDHDALGRFFG